MRITKGLRRRALVLVVAASVLVAVVAATSSAKPSAGFLTAKPAMLAPVAAGVEVKPLLTVGDTVGGYKFESIPDGIAVDKHHSEEVDVYVNHELSLVPFGARGSDFTNSLLSKLTLNRETGGTLAGRYVIDNTGNYQRFCSNFLVGKKQGFERDLVLTNEEARDWVNRTGPAVPATQFAPGAEQAGVVVAYDVESGQHRTIYGMGRHNHENDVGLPGYHKPVILSGDDTFDAPASQLYVYTAEDGNAVWNDEGRLYAFVSDNPAIDDYGDLTSTPTLNSTHGHFIEVPRMIATGKKPDGSEVRAADFGFPAPTGSVLDGPQWVLEYWSHNIAHAFQFIRIEDIAYDRHHANVVYFADTGEPRALRDTTTGRLRRGPNVTPPVGPFPNGRIFKMVLDKKNPLEVESLSILSQNTDFDASGYNNVNVAHQPDNVETTKNALLITEDPGGHNQGATAARVWRYDLKTGALDVVLRVDHSSDPTTPKQALGNWESSGIVDASKAFGKDMFLIDVQAHGWELNTQTNPTLSRENGQLLLVKIPGT